MKKIEYAPGLMMPVLEVGDTIRVILSDSSTDYIEITVDGAQGLRVRCGDGHLAVLPRSANEALITKIGRWAPEG